MLINLKFGELIELDILLFVLLFLKIYTAHQPNFQYFLETGTKIS